MRLHRLEVQAFGPFAGREVVDLDALGEAGLFLICGPTGAGKTSLLDAVSFALFGRVPGPRRPKLLKSQHAGSAEVPEVVLEVTLRARRFRITRSPAFERPGRKHPVQARIVLDEHLHGRWTQVATRLDEAGRIMEDVLGMTAEQFHRVVVLPQGDVAAFLHASDDDRGALLRRLFDVESFAEVEAWLVEERRRTEAETRDASRDLDGLRESVLGLVGELGDRADAAGKASGPADEATWSTLGPAALHEAVSTLVAEHRRTEVDALAATDAAEAAMRDAALRLETARAVATAHDRGVQARELVARRERETPEHRARRASLDAARRADSVTGHQRAVERAEVAHRSALTAVEEASRDLPEEATARDTDGVRGWLTTLQVHDDAVDDLRHARRTLANAAGSWPLRYAEAGQAAQRHSALMESSARLEAQVCATTTARDTAARGAEEGAAVADEIARTDRLLRSRRRLDTIEAVELPAAEDEVRDARDLAQDARGTHQSLVARRLSEMAGELAERLETDEPCPVCGSLDHPAPASREQAVDDARLERAEAAWRAAEEEVLTRRARAAELVAEAHQHRALLDDEPRDAAALTEALAEGRRAASVAQAQDRQRRDLEDELTRLTAEREAHEEQLRRSDRSLTRARSLADEARALRDSSREELRRLVEAHGERCPCGLGAADPTATTDRTGDSTHDSTHDGADEADDARLLERAGWWEHRHAGTVRRARALAEARSQADHAEEARAGALTDRTEAMERSGFADLTEVYAARLDASAVARLTAQVEEHEHELAGSRQTLADPEVAAALDQGRPDVDAAADAATAARHAWQQAARDHASVQHVSRELHARARRIESLTDRLGPLLERRELVAALADLATGRGEQNPDGVSLTTYVLATRLERIVALANERLEQMVDGRYELAVDHGRRDRRSRGGLGLQVLDRWTGEHRPATTLSGGETFIVSLALALGTADGVREEAGGIEVQTLFVDEGFGSLDDDALEQVMTVLDELRTAGRAVGVISHVADMRQRIPAQVQVSRTSSGSSVTVSHPGDPADSDAA